MPDKVGRLIHLSAAGPVEGQSMRGAIRFSHSPLRSRPAETARLLDACGRGAFG